MKAIKWILTTLIVTAMTLGMATDARSAPQVKKPAVKATQTKKTSSKKKSTKKKSTKKSTKSTKTVKKPIVKPDPLNAPMVGTWYTMDAEGKFAKANKFVFTPTGEFNYIGPGWKSGGTFTLREGVVTLSWLQIDGQPVKPGTIKKQIPMAEKKFQIERFVYGKAA